MATKTVTDEQLLEAFDLLLGAGLAYAPGLDMVELTMKTWRKLLADIPGAAVLAAAREIALRGERFPSVAEMRKRAEALSHSPGRLQEVQRAAGVEPEPEDPYPFIAVVGPDGWRRYVPGTLQTPVLALELAEALARLEEKYQGVDLPTDAELAYIDSLIDLYSPWE